MRNCEWAQMTERRLILKVRVNSVGVRLPVLSIDYGMTTLSTPGPLIRPFHLLTLLSLNKNSLVCQWDESSTPLRIPFRHLRHMNNFAARPNRNCVHLRRRWNEYVEWGEKNIAKLIAFTRNPIVRIGFPAIVANVWEIVTTFQAIENCVHIAGDAVSNIVRVVASCISNVSDSINQQKIPIKR